MPIELAPGATVYVEPPAIPEVYAVPPGAAGSITGPAGPQGPVGPQGPGGTGGGSGSSTGIHVTDYGAVGNDATDDTVSLQSALNAAIAGNVTNALGNTVHLSPNKNYKITAALTWPSNVTIDGHGSSIHQVTANANALVSTDGVNLGLRDITIRGPVSGSPSGTGRGILCQRSVNANIRSLSWDQVVVHSFGSDGIELSNPITCSLSTVEARSCAGHGFNIHGVTGAAAGTSVSFDGCFGNGNVKAGFRFTTMAYCALNGCAADSNGIGYELVNGQGIVFTGCGAESQVNNNALAAGYSGFSWKISGGFGVSLVGCWTFEQPSIGIWVTGNATTVIIAGYTENTPLVGATYCIQNDTGSTTTTLMNISNSKPLNLIQNAIIVNDGGGLSIPGYGYFGGTLRSEGALSSGSWIKPVAVTTVGRPSAVTAGQSAMIYDTTLNKPIWSTGSVWQEAGTSSGSGHVIEDKGTPLTARTNLNFVGAGVSAADSGGKTVVTIPRTNSRVLTSVNLATVTGSELLEGTPVIDGLSTTVGDRVLQKDDGFLNPNGIYIVGSGSWALAPDWEVLSVDERKGALVSVESGDVNNHKLFYTPDGEFWRHTESITILNDGTELLQRSKINFVGTGVDAVVSGNQINVSIPGGSGIGVIAPVRATNPAKNQLYLNGLTDSPMDGVALVNGDRVWYQHDGIPGDSGVRIVNSTGSWTKAPDMADGMVFLSGSTVLIEEGVQLGGKQYIVKNASGASSWTVAGYPSGPILTVALPSGSGPGPDQTLLSTSFGGGGGPDFYRVGTTGFTRIVLTTDAIISFLETLDNHVREFQLVVEQNSVGGHYVLWSPRTIAWSDGIEPKVDPAPYAVTYIRGVWLGINYGLSCEAIPQPQYKRRLPNVYNGVTLGIAIDVMRGTSETSIRNAIAMLNRWTTLAHRNVLGANGVVLQYSDGFAVDNPMAADLRGAWEFYGGFTVTGGSVIRGNPVPYNDGTGHEYYHAEHNYYFPPPGFTDPGGGAYAPYAGLTSILLDHPVVRDCWYRAFNATTSRTITGCTTTSGSAIVTCSPGQFTAADLSGSIVRAGISGAGIPAPTRTVSCTTTNGFNTVTVPSGSFTVADVGAGISGAGLSAGTGVISVNSLTQITVSSLATATASGVTLTVTSQTKISSYQSTTQITMSANATATASGLTLTVIKATGNQSGLAEWWAQMRTSKKIAAAGDPVEVPQLQAAGNVASVVTDFENFITHTAIAGG